MTINAIEQHENRNRTLRLLMLLIIVGTFPFYCLGVVIIGSAPSGAAQSIETATADGSNTPIGADVTLSPTASPTGTRLVTATSASTLAPTPYQYVPPTRVVATNTFIPQPTVFIPSPTDSPTLTPSIGDSDSDGVNDNDDDCPNTFGP